MVEARGRCGDSGGQSPSLMEGGDGGSCGGRRHWWKVVMVDRCGRSPSLMKGGDGGSCGGSGGQSSSLVEGGDGGSLS